MVLLIWGLERKKREELKREKEKRAQHYQNRVKSAPTKPAKKLEEPVQEIRETDDEIPVSRWKRFLRWWNT